MAEPKTDCVCSLRMVGQYIAMIIIYTFYNATFALERPFNNVQYLRSNILDGKFFLKCNISASNRNFKIIAPSNKLYGFCQKGRLRRWVCSNTNIKPHMESNIITVEINIRISNENCGEWKCIHGGKQDIVNIKSVEKLCNIMRGVHIERKSDCKVVALKYHRLKTVFKLSCIIFQRPIGNTVNFLLNYTTVDSLRFYNNTCYNRNRACSGGTDICGCVYTGNVFTMNYEIENKGSVYINTMFGVQMLLNGNNGNVVQMILLRIYNGKEFGKLETITKTVSNVHAVIPKVKTVQKDVHNGTGISTFLLVIFLSAVMIFTFRKLCQRFTQCKGSESMNTNTKETKCL